MSLKHMEKITCPDCGKEGDFVIWQSINTQLDPQAKVDLLTGKLFAFTCPHCKSTHNVDYGLLYHQMEDELMIQYATSEKEANDAVEQFENIATGNLVPGMKPMDMNYTFRLVFSQNQLREKVYIFDNGMDDRVIELMKVFMISQLASTNPDLEISEMFLEMTERGPEKFAVHLEDGHWGSTDFAQDMYDGIKEAFIDEVDDGKHEYIVNMQWALSKIKKEK